MHKTATKMVSVNIASARVLTVNVIIAAMKTTFAPILVNILTAIHEGSVKILKCECISNEHNHGNGGYTNEMLSVREERADSHNKCLGVVSQNRQSLVSNDNSLHWKQMLGDSIVSIYATLGSRGA